MHLNIKYWYSVNTIRLHSTQWGEERGGQGTVWGGGLLCEGGHRGENRGGGGLRRPPQEVVFG
jgi:hypothetical protein